MARRFLAISGSIRRESVNTAALEVLREIAPPEVTVALFDGLAGLPHFNPDLDTATPPAVVAAFRHEIEHAAALVICSPEYAHGVPGVLKNALDWLVSYEPFAGKPVALLNARPRATWAIASLRETLTTMDARLVESACVTLPLDSNRFTTADLLARPDVTALLRTALDALIAATAPADQAR